MKRKKYVIALVSILTFLVFFYVHLNYVQKNPGGADSIPRWVGTKAWIYEGISPYDKVVGERSQIIINGRLASGVQDQQLFVYPFYTTLFYLPVIWLSYEAARAIWMIVMELSIIGILIYSRKLYKWTPPIWLLGLSIGLVLLMYNSIRTIILWQMAGVVAFLIIYSIWALRENKDILAGIALAFSTIKPQMIFLILPFLILWAIPKRKKFLISFGLTLLLISGFSFIMEPNWLNEMLAQMKVYLTYTLIPSWLTLFTGLFPSNLGNVLYYVLFIVFVGWLIYEWIIVRIKNKNLDFAVALTLLVSNIIIIRTATTNYLMMVPIFFYIFSIAEKKYADSSYSFVVVAQLLYFVGTWILFAFTYKNSGETWPSYIPLPILLICGLLWVRLIRKENLSLSGL